MRYGKQRNGEPAGQPQFLKILVIDDVAEIGGAEVSLISLLQNYNRQKYRLIPVIPRRGGLSRRFDELRIPYKIVKMNRLEDTKNPIVLLFYIFRFIIGVLSIAFLAKKENICLVHTVTQRAHLYGGIAAKLCGIPFVPWLQDYPTNIWIRAMLQLILKFAASVIVVNSRSTEKVYASDRKIASKTTLIYPPTEMRLFNPDISPIKVKRELGLSDNYPIVGLIGHINPVKGHTVFIEAAKYVIEQFPAARFLIIGGIVFHKDVAYANQLKKLVKEKRLTNDAVFLGFRSDVPEIIASLDIFVLASLTEPFGKVVVEAMAMKKPVVATRVGGVPEIIEHGKSGILIPPGDVMALADAIIKIAKDKDRARRVGVEGRRTVIKKFNLDAFLQRFERVFDKYSKSPRQLAGSSPLPKIIEVPGEKQRDFGQFRSGGPEKNEPK